MIVYTNVVQGTSVWAALRAGIPTASCFSEIMTPGKAKSGSQESYLNYLLAERMLRRPIDGYQSQAMADGNRFEHNAVAAYEFQHNVTTQKIGFVLSDDGRIGCSPDRFIEEHPTRALEVKAPGSPEVHVSYLRASTGAMKKYIVQLMGQLWLCEKDEIDIISYFPGMPDATFRVTRDEDTIKQLTVHVREFSDRLEELSQDFIKRGWMKPRIQPGYENKETDESGFITQEDADAILRLRFPESYDNAERQSTHE